MNFSEALKFLKLN